MTDNELRILKNSTQYLKNGFFAAEDKAQNTLRTTENILMEVADKMRNNYPYHHPLYAGQMLKPPHPVAKLAYALAMEINPNNHALDGSKASSPMEKEAVSQLAEMFGYDTHIGHLTSSGTIANLEALWVAGQLHPEKRILASELAHYTHNRISSVLKLPFAEVKADLYGRMDVSDLTELLHKGDVGTVVVTLGTTGTGSVDPLEDILQLQKEFDFRIHIDAAYGGYFKLAEVLDQDTMRHFSRMAQADSIVIDPHKHGLQPYGCGCILFKDPGIGKLYSHDSPYTYFTSDDLHLGEISLECSRSGAAAVALWATLKQFPLVRNGKMAAGLDNCHKAAVNLFEKIDQDPDFIILIPPETDIVVWTPTGDSASAISQQSKAMFEACAEKGLHLALLNYPVNLLPEHWQKIRKDQEFVTCLRSCLMKWEHNDWIDKIWDIIQSTK
ncbi:MAG: aminotransferase class I/II-fold pyridoxal phosphate-dependent enzyme [Bacteroidota bacterium]